MHRAALNQERDSLGGSLPPQPPYRTRHQRSSVLRLVRVLVFRVNFRLQRGDTCGEFFVGQALGFCGETQSC